MILQHSINKIEHIYDITWLSRNKLLQVEFFDSGRSDTWGLVRYNLRCDAPITTVVTSIESGYDTATILEVLINTLVQKNVISEQEANYVKQAEMGTILGT